MTDDQGMQGRWAAVPLFPLPNVVLLPGAVLPLHIFEERYKRMTADALAGPRLVAMALLKSGWEKDYYQAPEIEPGVCVGRILSHERLPDGRYNFLLQGLARARVDRELRTHPYRVADLLQVPERPVPEIDLAAHRKKLRDLLATGPWSTTNAGQQFARALASPMHVAEVADLIAFNLIEDLRLKQSLLEDGNVQRRVGRVVEALERMAPVIAAAAERDADGPCLN